MTQPHDFYHVGLVVPDIEHAAAQFASFAGYQWTKPIEYTVPVSAASGDIDVPFAFIFSLETPHLELVQEVPGTLWTATPAGAVHHLGYWVDDIMATAQRLEHAGFELEAHPQGDELSAFAYYRNPAGARIEIVDRALFPDWRGFLNGMKRT